jgi:hypothetical protein
MMTMREPNPERIAPPEPPPPEPEPEPAPPVPPEPPPARLDPYGHEPRTTWRDALPWGALVALLAVLIIVAVAIRLAGSR